MLVSPGWSRDSLRINRRRLWDAIYKLVRSFPYPLPLPTHPSFFEPVLSDRFFVQYLLKISQGLQMSVSLVLSIIVDGYLRNVRRRNGSRFCFDFRSNCRETRRCIFPSSIMRISRPTNETRTVLDFFRVTSHVSRYYLESVWRSQRDSTLSSLTQLKLSFITVDRYYRRSKRIDTCRNYESKRWHAYVPYDIIIIQLFDQIYHRSL